MITHEPVLTIIFSFLALVISLVALSYSKKEKPCIMPYGHSNNQNHLILDLKNIGDKHLHAPTLLINIFDNNLNEVHGFPIEDKLLFSIGCGTTFNYGITIDEKTLNNNFHIRVRFKGSYNRFFPFLKKKTLEQTFWYSGFLLFENNGNKTIKLVNSHRDEIPKIKAKHSSSLLQYEKNIDKKFKN